jgi:hypothetical protein
MIWIGPGFGISEVYVEYQNGYKMITQKMANRTFGAFTWNIKAFNLFANLECYHENPETQASKQEIIRGQLKTFIMSEDPMKLPSNMRAGPPPSDNPMEESTNGYKICSTCHKRGHCHIMCKEKEKEEQKGETEDSLWSHVHLLVI